ncbi:MAG TPA: arsenic transporter [Pseudolabrys sp.]|nr:arsenic transporter [Pseudolabrys sp.]
MLLTAANVLTLAVAALAIAGVIVRPMRWPEAIWAVAGAVAVVVFGLLPLNAALGAVGAGLDVYLFLTGMMLLSETARREGLFDWLAVEAVLHARGSPTRLFLLVYIVGTIVSVFMSNDATAVVLTPAVFAAARKAKREPMAYLFICAFVANAASFVLPISNPANIVLYGGHMPALTQWLASFALPSLVAILVTYAALRWCMRRRLTGDIADLPPRSKLPRGAFVALAGIVLTALALIVSSALDIKFGWPAAIGGVATVTAVLVTEHASPWPVLRHVSWSIVPLVAGLFVLVRAVEGTGVIADVTLGLAALAQQSQTVAAIAAGGVIAVVANLMNNLPVGLIAASVLTHAQPPLAVTDAALIGVDLGPNLSVTGSLATILWLLAIRRDGEHVDFWSFLKVGAVVMPPALVLTIAARLLV